MIRIAFARSWARDGWDVYAHRYTSTRGRIPFKITITEMPEVDECSMSEPSVHLDGRSGHLIIQALLEGLQEANLMPKMGATEAELKATIRHLSDMRSLVFERLPPKELS